MFDLFYLLLPYCVTYADVETDGLCVDRNRSKFQPRGHFDAAVGGRRRSKQAAAGSALEQLRQRRLQQAAASGKAHSFVQLVAAAP